MNVDFSKLVPSRFLSSVRNDLGTSAVLALKRLDKIATARTAQSIRTEGAILNDGLEFDVYAAAGMKYIIEGKSPNTKMPVKKVGDKYELFPEIKDWKAVRNFRGSDFMLARAIARNEQKPIDVAGMTLEIFQDIYGDKITSRLLTFYTSEVGDEFKKNTQ